MWNDGSGITVRKNPLRVLRVERVNPNPTRLIAGHEYLTRDRPAYQTSRVKWVIRGSDRVGLAGRVVVCHLWVLVNLLQHC